jgi:hypothetical protein
MASARHMMPLAAEKPIIPHTDKQQLKTNIMAKKIVKSKASKPAPKKAAAKKPAAKKK